jgi:predicted nucleic acid-binding protein
VRYLLDVNVLLAMRYEAHAHHDRVSSWLREKRFIHSNSLRLATSPITELGFVRIASGPAGFANDVGEAQADLERLVGQQGLAFVEDRLRAYPLPQWVQKFTQTTDGHLLQVAVSHGLTLATLDRGIRGAEVISEIHVHPLRVQEAGVLGDAYSNDDGLWVR